jgi:hypothetical protein
MVVFNFNKLFYPNLILLLFMLHCGIVGFAVNSQLNLFRDTTESKDNAYLQWFFALSSGLMANITLLFLLGITGWLNRYAVFLGGLALMAFAILILLFSFPFQDRIKRIHLGPAGILEILALLALFLVLGWKAVRVPGNCDDTFFHLPLARFYIEHQMIALNEYLRLPLAPQNVDLLFALGLMMGGDILAQGMAILPLFIISVGLIGAGVWLLGPTIPGSIIPGFLSVLVLLSLGPVNGNAGFAYIDDGLALFCWGAILALALWVSADDRSKGWVVIAGMLAGGAAGSKYLGGVLALLIGLYLLAIRRDWRASLTYAIAVIVFGSWWYIRSAVISGDPFHPAGGNIFGHFLWNADDLLRQKHEMMLQGAGKSSLNIYSALLKAHVLQWAPAFLSLIFFKKEGKPLRLLQIVFLSYFLFWFFSIQVSRYLAPIFAVGSFLSIYFLYRVVIGPFILALASRKAWLGNPYIPGALCLVLLLTIGATSYRAAVNRVAHWDEVLESRTGYTLIQQANKLIPIFGSRLIQVGFGDFNYFFNGTAIGDVFGPGRYSEMTNCDDSHQLISPSAMTALMQRFNSRMLAVNTKRFAIDVAAYQEYFDIRQESADGLLLVKKQSFN